jgi:hypothetical protein
VNAGIELGFRFIHKCNPKDSRSRNAGTSKQAKTLVQLHEGHRRIAAKYQHSLLFSEHIITLLRAKRKPAPKKEYVHVVCPLRVCLSQLRTHDPRHSGKSY